MWKKTELSLAGAPAPRQKGAGHGYLHSTQSGARNLHGASSKKCLETVSHLKCDWYE